MSLKGMPYQKLDSTDVHPYLHLNPKSSWSLSFCQRVSPLKSWASPPKHTGRSLWSTIMFLCLSTDMFSRFLWLKQPGRRHCDLSLLAVLTRHVTVTQSGGGGRRELTVQTGKNYTWLLEYKKLWERMVWNVNPVEPKQLEKNVDKLTL